jgi:hypothetical protein
LTVNVLNAKSGVPTRTCQNTAIDGTGGGATRAHNGQHDVFLHRGKSERLRDCREVRSK